MRINLNKQSTIDKLMLLCNQAGCSPTRLLIDIIENYELNSLAQGCNRNDTKTTTRSTNDDLQ